MIRQLSTKAILTGNQQQHDLERFLVDSDIDPELVILLRKVGFKATHVTFHPNIPNDDTELLKWGRKQGYILVCHDKHKDAKTMYSFYSEMYYHGGRVIRVGKPGQSTLRLLGCILAQRHKWSEFFNTDSGEASVHPSGCNPSSASKLLDRSSYTMRIPFPDPSIPLKERQPLKKTKSKVGHKPSNDQLGPFIG